MHGLDGEALPSWGLSKVYSRADRAHCILYYTTPNEYHALVPLIRIGPVHSILWVLNGCICPHERAMHLSTPDIRLGGRVQLDNPFNG